MYEKGEGVAQDLVVACQWYDIAALRGDIEAVRLQAAIREKLTPEQITEAERLAQQWLKGRTK
jgi:hypothetical protein